MMEQDYKPVHAMLHGRRIKLRLLFLLLGLAGWLVIVGLLQIRDLREAAADSRQVYERLTGGLEVISNLQFETQECRRVLLRQLTDSIYKSDEQEPGSPNLASQRVERYIRLAHEQATSPAITRAASTVEMHWQHYMDNRDRVLALVEEQRFAEALKLEGEQGTESFLEVREALERLEELEKNESGQQFRAAAARVELAQVRLFAHLAVCLLAGGLGFFGFMRGARKAARLVSDVIESLNEMVLVFDSDLLLRVWNQPANLFLQGASTSPRGLPLNAILPEFSSSIVRASLSRVREGEQTENFASFALTRNGIDRYYDVHISPIEQGISIVLKDVTSREEAQQATLRHAEALRISEERFELAINGANDGIWDLDLIAQTAHYSQRWLAMVGRHEAPEHPDLNFWLTLVHKEDVNPLRRAFAAHIEDLTPHLEIEVRMADGSGGERWMLVRGLAVRNAAGKATRIAGSMTDISERKQTEEQLRYSVLHDALTGLPNRTLFMDRLQQAIEHGRRREQYGFAVLFLDMDRFKVINDSLGHLVGDQLLIALGERIGGLLRSGDTLARMGGDEFTLLLDDVRTAEQAMEVANRIQAAMKEPFVLAGQEVVVSLSIGIASETKGYERPEDLLRDADTALYRAKHLGRARAETFDTAMHSKAVRRLQLETDLRRAIERKELVIFYQPIVALDSGKLSGFEALLRWRHPELGLVAPLEFIPVAEETGLICAVGEWVLRESCRQMKEWSSLIPDLTDAFISVNVAPRQLAQPDLVERVNEALRETGLEPSRLKLEITESTAMESAEQACQTLTELSALGIHIAIDDFGTGYSSLSYLHRFPATTLKIDRSFVEQIDSDNEKMEIIRTIVVMAANLGLDVVAEGIETDEQRRRLNSLQCAQGQGYYFARPVDSLTITQMLAQQGSQASFGGPPLVRPPVAIPPRLSQAGKRSSEVTLQ